MLFNTSIEAENYVADTVKRYLDERHLLESVLVLIRQRYNNKDDYEYLKELMLVEDCRLVFEYDWNEGQKDVDVIAIIPVDEIEEFSYTVNEQALKDYKNRK